MYLVFSTALPAADRGASRVNSPPEVSGKLTSGELLTAPRSAIAVKKLVHWSERRCRNSSIIRLWQRVSYLFQKPLSCDACD